MKRIFLMNCFVLLFLLLFISCEGSSPSSSNKEESGDGNVGGTYRGVIADYDSGLSGIFALEVPDVTTGSQSVNVELDLSTATEDISGTGTLTLNSNGNYAGLVQVTIEGHTLILSFDLTDEGAVATVLMSIDGVDILGGVTAEAEGEGETVETWRGTYSGSGTHEQYIEALDETRYYPWSVSGYWNFTRKGNSGNVVYSGEVVVTPASGDSWEDPDQGSFGLDLLGNNVSFSWGEGTFSGGTSSGTWC